MPGLKKLVIKVSLFLLLSAVCTLPVYLVPADRSFDFRFTYRNCMGQGAWIYERLYKNPSPIDIAFIGSSHTICAINDSLVENKMNRSNAHIHVANFGYCRYGRNLHYTFARQLLEQKHPDIIVLEVCETENRSGHPEYAYFADAKDIFNPVWLFNSNMLHDVYDGVFIRFARFKKNFNYVRSIAPEWTRLYSYQNSDQVADPATLPPVHSDIQAEKPDNTGRWFYNQYSFSYINRIANLAEANGAKVLFLYLPAYGSSSEPREAIFYRSNGSLIIPPSEILNDPAYWKDKEHMNNAGATKLADWLADVCRSFVDSPVHS